MLVHMEYFSMLISSLLAGSTPVMWWASPSPQTGSSCTAPTRRALWQFTTPRRKATAWSELCVSARTHTQTNFTLLTFVTFHVPFVDVSLRLIGQVTWWHEALSALRTPWRWAATAAAWLLSARRSTSSPSQTLGLWMRYLFRSRLLCYSSVISAYHSPLAVLLQTP